METLFQDFRYGIRMLWKSRSFTLIAVLALALGIGANTAIFSLINAILLQPLPFKDADQIVYLFDTQPIIKDAPASYPDFTDWGKQNRVFSQLAAVFNKNLNYAGESEPELVRALLVSEQYFSLLGAQPIIGRVFTLDEHKPGGNPVALISPSLWQRQFGGDSSVIGKTARLDGVNYTIIGVMSPMIASLKVNWRTEIWLPLEANLPWPERSTHYLTVLGRLKPGINITAAQTEMNQVAKQIDNESKTGHGIMLMSMKERLVGKTRPSLLLMLGAVALILLIAAANIANLLLARATGRTREFAIRTALGAGRARLIRQVLSESVLLAFMGGICGTLLALWGVDLLASAWPESFYRPINISLDWRGFAFTAALSLLTGIIFGLVPALFAANTNLTAALKDGSVQASAGAQRNRWRSMLVISEITLATVLLLGAGLMLKSFWRLQQVDPGFHPESVLSFQLSLPTAKYSPSARLQFYQDLLAKLKTLPSIDAVGAINNLPLGGGGTNGDFQVEGQPFPAAQQPLVEQYISSPDYFSTLKIPLVRGRVFSETDRPDGLKVVVINETMARRFWPNQDPLGKRISWSDDDHWLTVIGVVGDVKQESLEQTVEYQSYVPFQQVSAAAMTIVTRTAKDPTSLIAAIKSEVQMLDRERPVYNIKSLDELLNGAVAERRQPAFLLAIFAALALLLAAVGIYGVISYSVSQRTQEIGIRMALGAQKWDVLSLIIGQGMKLVLIGIGLGLIATLALARVLASLLFEVSASDPLTFITISLLLTLVAFCACFIPANRATRIDPISALKWE